MQDTCEKNEAQDYFQPITFQKSVFSAPACCQDSESEYLSTKNVSCHNTMVIVLYVYLINMCIDQALSVLLCIISI